MNIISVPSVFLVKTSSVGWINFALIRKWQFANYEGKNTCQIVWSTGETELFHGIDAVAVKRAIEELQNKQNSLNRYRLFNRRKVT